MTPEERESAIRRIMALMAKTVANGCSEEEAMAAAEMVTRLLNKYQLDLTDIEIQSSPVKDATVDTRQKTKAPIDSVVTSIGYLTDTKVWRAPGEGSFGGIMYHFLGLEHDTLVATYLYSICDRAIVFGWEDYKSEINFSSMSAYDKPKAKEQFQYGMAHRLARRLREMKDAQKQSNAQSTGRDLVVVKNALIDEHFAKMGINLRGAGAGKRVNASHHYQAGSAAGDRVNLNKGVARSGSGGHLR